MINLEIVREMRHLYRTTDMTTKELEQHFGYVGINAILHNRLWYDPSYCPPKPRARGPRPKLIEISGESKTVRQWTRDPQCQVAAATINKRYREGVRGAALLRREKNSGRPRGACKQ